MAAELGIPIDAPIPDEAFEIIRVWICDGDMRLSMKGDLWDDPAAFGMMLADLARHYTRASQKAAGNEKAFLERIKAGADVEFDRPTE